MVTAFAVATGYGIALPRLPALLYDLPGASSEAWRSRHVSGVTAIYFGGALLAAPFWGRLSDRLGRRPIMALGAFGFAIAFPAIELVDSLGQLYLARALDGAFSAAVAPTALAYLADRWANADARARQFAWLNASVLLGYLGGPLVGEAVAPFGSLAPYALPALTATLGALLLIGVEPVRPKHSGHGAAVRGRVRARAFLLGLSAVAAGSVVAQEIAVAVPLGADDHGRTSASLLLSFCGAVMFLTQVIIFSGRDSAARAVRLLRPLLIVLAAGLAVTPLASSFWPLALVIAVVAAAAAALNVAASYLTSRLQSGAQGAGLGLQYGAVSAGQLLAALGAGASQAAGVPAAVWIAGFLSLGLTAAPRSTWKRAASAG